MLGEDVAAGDEMSQEIRKVIAALEKMNCAMRAALAAMTVDPSWQELVEVAKRYGLTPSKFSTFFCRCGVVMRRRRTFGHEPDEYRTVCRGCRHRERQRRKTGR